VPCPYFNRNHTCTLRRPKRPAGRRTAGSEGSPPRAPSGKVQSPICDSLNAVLPGSVRTPMLVRAAEAEGGDPEETIASWGRAHPRGTVIEPTEAAALVLWLLSDEASARQGWHPAPTRAPGLSAPTSPSSPRRPRGARHQSAAAKAGGQCRERGTRSPELPWRWGRQRVPCRRSRLPLSPMSPSADRTHVREHGLISGLRAGRHRLRAGPHGPPAVLQAPGAG